MTQGLTVEDDLLQLYLIVTSNIEGWVDVSQSVCRELAYQGMLLQNINHMLHIRTLPNIQSEVSYSVAKSSETNVNPHFLHPDVAVSC